MAKAVKKKSAKEGSDLFHKIMAASVPNKLLHLTPKEKLFKEGLDSIENKYAKELEKLNSSNKIADHFKSMIENDSLFQLIWNSDSDLPTEIRLEVKNLANNIWGAYANKFSQT